MKFFFSKLNNNKQKSGTVEIATTHYTESKLYEKIGKLIILNGYKNTTIIRLSKITSRSGALIKSKLYFMKIIENYYFLYELYLFS